jgi:hypothetical protein
MRDRTLIRRSFVLAAVAGVCWMVVGIGGPPYDVMAQPTAQVSDQARRDALGVFATGFGLWQAGEYEAAEAAFRRGLELDPENPQANYYLGEILLRRGARNHARAALELAASHEGGAREMFLARGLLRAMESGSLDFNTYPHYAHLPGNIDESLWRGAAGSALMSVVGTAEGWHVSSASRSEVVFRRGRNRHCLNDVLLTSNPEHRQRLWNMRLHQRAWRIGQDHRIEAASEEREVSCRSRRNAGALPDFRFDWSPRYQLQLELPIISGLIGGSSSNHRWNEASTVPISGHSLNIDYDFRTYNGHLQNHSVSCTVAEPRAFGPADFVFPFSVLALDCRKQLSDRTYTFQEFWIPELALNLEGFVDSTWRQDWRSSSDGSTGWSAMEVDVGETEFQRTDERTWTATTTYTIVVTNSYERIPSFTHARTTIEITAPERE